MGTGPIDYINEHIKSYSHNTPQEYRKLNLPVC
jgi:hypothetical protein